jgi:hypothetical protein
MSVAGAILLRQNSETGASNHGTTVRLTLPAA